METVELPDQPKREQVKRMKDRWDQQSEW